jgi:hypothetical protein
MMGLPKSKSAALSLGVVRYFTGVPCKNGHISARYTKGGHCSECINTFNKSERGLAWHRNYEKTPKQKERRNLPQNKEKRIERDRVRYPKRREWSRDNRFKNKYGLSLKEFEERKIAQGNKCAICKIVFADKSHTNSSCCVDHCHSTGIVRGLLCTSCNHGIGKFFDSPFLLRNAANYLKRHINSATISHGSKREAR